jgi:hypothetical protein
MCGILSTRSTTLSIKNTAELAVFSVFYLRLFSSPLPSPFFKKYGGFFGVVLLYLSLLPKHEKLSQIGHIIHVCVLLYFFSKITAKVATFFHGRGVV